MESHSAEQGNIFYLGTTFQQLFYDDGNGDSAMRFVVGATFDPVRKTDHDFFVRSTQFFERWKSEWFLQRTADGFGRIYFRRIVIQSAKGENSRRIGQFNAHFAVTII